MRLIDADALSREIEKIKWNLQMLDDTQSSGKVWNGVRMAEKKVESAPTIYAVPVVRCKVCIYYDNLCRCDLLGIPMERLYSKDADEEPCRSCRFSSMWDKNKQQSVSVLDADNRKDG